MGDAGYYARWIAVAYFALLIGFPARTSTAIFGLQQSFAVVELLRTLASALAVVLIARSGGEALLAVAVAASAQSLISLGFIAFVGVRLRRFDQQNAHPARLASKAKV